VLLADERELIFAAAAALITERDVPRERSDLDVLLEDSVLDVEEQSEYPSL
jgi:hypothetical protein